jgi:hypothetical protein
MGMYDDFRDGDRYGQIKCWGKSLSSYEIGSHVMLHEGLDEDTARSVAAELDGLDATIAERGGADHLEPRRAELYADLYDGVANPQRRDYQVLCRDGSALVVRDGIWVDWADAPVDGLDLVDNRGRAAEPGDTGRGAWVNPQP